MILARKLRSAVWLYQRGGLATVAESAWGQSQAYMQANAILPLSDQRKAARLTRIFNDRPEYSFVPFDADDVRSCRAALLLPYLRQQFFDVIGSVPDDERLTDAEIPLLADSLFRRWEFKRLDGALPGWRDRLARSKFSHALSQMARRVALRLGRVSEAGVDLPEAGGDVADCLLRAEVFDAQDRLPEANRAFQQAVHRHSHEAVVRLHYAFHLLKLGRLWEGLENWGVADSLLGTYPLRKHRRRWAGEDLAGKTLLVVFEHGLGDMIQFARFLHPLRAAQPHAKVIGCVPRPLVGLLQRSFPWTEFVAVEDPDPAYDLYVASLQLPLVIEASSLLPNDAYLRLDGSAVERTGGRGRVGICWRGHPRQYELTRSIPIETFATLFSRDDLDFVVLLNKLTPEEGSFLAGIPNVLCPPINDFVELGGLVASCDLIVSVDTAVTHVAGAGGKSSLLLSRPDACWRWGESGAKSVWYEAVEVLRHPGDMDWSHVLSQAAQRIEEHFAPEKAEVSAA